MALLLGSVFGPARRQAIAVRQIEEFYEKGSRPLYPFGNQPVVVGYNHGQEGRPKYVPDSAYRRFMIETFGSEYFGDVVTVQLDGANFGDNDVGTLAIFPNLAFLRLAETNITDRGLKYLAGCPNIEFLALNGTAISDDGLIHLREFPRLRRLSLSSTGITDEAIPVLSSLEHLRALFLKGTNVSEEGYRELEQAMPECKIQPPTQQPHQQAQ